MKTDFFKENAFRIIFVVFFLLAFVWMGTKQTILSNSNSAADWLPSQFQQTRDYNWYLSNFPFESYVVVSWEGCELGDDRIELLAHKLVPQQTIDNYSLSGDSDGFKADLQLERAPEEAKDELDEATGETTNISTQALVDASGDDGPVVEGGDGALYDPWGVEYKYERKGKKIVVISAGPDGEFGGEDDIRSDTTQRAGGND